MHSEHDANRKTNLLPSMHLGSTRCLLQVSNEAGSVLMIVDQEQRNPWQPQGAHQADRVLLELNPQRSGHLLL